MIICKLCNQEFQNNNSLVSHLSNSKSNCKISIKEYYDKFIKKENEGICLFCGDQTAFFGITKGYVNNVCKHCRNKKEESKKLRSNNYKKKKENKKIQDGYYNYSEQCEICNENNEIVKFKSKSGLIRHIIQKHKIDGKEYYNKYLKKNEYEGTCKITGTKTKFKNINEGFFIYNGKGINSKDLEVKKKKEETNFKNHGVLFPCFINSEERINHYKETRQKSKNLKETRLKLINLLKLLTIESSNKLQCQMCGSFFNNSNSLTTHIQKFHNIKIKDYYDKFFKKENEGRCLISNLETNFDCFDRGYYKYHKLFITYGNEIKEGNKKWQQQYITKKIKDLQPNFEVEFIDLDSINHIGDLTKIKCLKCGKIYQNRFTNLINGHGKCTNCNHVFSKQSIGELQLIKEIQDLNTNLKIFTSRRDIIKNPKTGKDLELDIFIPEKNIAIEYNGLYWHSEINQDNNYHLIKWSECNKKNIQLIQIFEDEWVDKKEIVLSMIKHKLNNRNNEKKIFARNCNIKEISPEEKNNFLDNNHIQGKDHCLIKLGAFYNNELISVMTFGRGNITRGGNPSDHTKWELSRFASNKKFLVVGIAGKLLEFFKNNYSWEEIYTYADLRFSTGNLYKQLGFSFVKQTQPNYFYTNNFTKRIHRYNLRKLPSDPIDIPEDKLRLIQGYYRIWDCGNLKFSLKK